MRRPAAAPLVRVLAVLTMLRRRRGRRRRLRHGWRARADRSIGATAAISPAGAVAVTPAAAADSTVSGSVGAVAAGVAAAAGAGVSSTTGCAGDGGVSTDAASAASIATIASLEASLSLSAGCGASSGVTVAWPAAAISNCFAASSSSSSVAVVCVAQACAAASGEGSSSVCCGRSASVRCMWLRGGSVRWVADVPLVRLALGRARRLAAGLGQQDRKRRRRILGLAHAFSLGQTGVLRLQNAGLGRHMRHGCTSRHGISHGQRCNPRAMPRISKNCQSFKSLS